LFCPINKVGAEIFLSFQFLKLEGAVSNSELKLDTLFNASNGLIEGGGKGGQVGCSTSER